LNAKTTILGFKIAELIWDAQTLDDLKYITNTCDEIIKIKKEQLETLELIRL